MLYLGHVIKENKSFEVSGSSLKVIKCFIPDEKDAKLFHDSLISFLNYFDITENSRIYIYLSKDENKQLNTTIFYNDFYKDNFNKLLTNKVACFNLNIKSGYNYFMNNLYDYISLPAPSDWMLILGYMKIAR